MVYLKPNSEGVKLSSLLSPHPSILSLQSSFFVPWLPILSLLGRKKLNLQRFPTSLLVRTSLISGVHCAGLEWSDLGLDEHNFSH